VVEIHSSSPITRHKGATRARQGMHGYDLPSHGLSHGHHMQQQQHLGGSGDYSDLPPHLAALMEPPSIPQQSTRSNVAGGVGLHHGYGSGGGIGLVGECGGGSVTMSMDSAAGYGGMGGLGGGMGARYASSGGGSSDGSLHTVSGFGSGTFGVGGGGSSNSLGGLGTGMDGGNDSRPSMGGGGLGGACESNSSMHVAARMGPRLGYPKSGSNLGGLGGGAMGSTSSLGGWSTGSGVGGSTDNLKAHAEFMTHLPPQLQQMVAQLSDGSPDWSVASVRIHVFSPSPIYQSSWPMVGVHSEPPIEARLEKKVKGISFPHLTYQKSCLVFLYSPAPNTSNSSCDRTLSLCYQAVSRKMAPQFFDSMRGQGRAVALSTKVFRYGYEGDAEQ
jgi:hypothetical protein